MPTTITPPIPLLIEDLGYLHPTSKSRQRYRFGLYVCQCGAKFKATMSSIKNGHTKSCGCYHKQQVTTHGLYKHPLYKVWGSMVDRTTNPKTEAFKDYGLRGISVCIEWSDSFKSFYNWSIYNGYIKGLEIDRINNDGNYEPSNCRFATRSIQSRNTRIINSRNTSGYRGVSWHKVHNSWISRIAINRKLNHIGYYNTALDAAKAYDAYVIEHNLEHTINGVCQ